MTRTLRHVVRGATALALLAVAAPALPCGEAKTSMAVKEGAPAAQKATTQAQAPKAPTAKEKKQATPTATASR